jgi:ubiquinone/menaquinone biosynthesis C-methylase UbiE
MIIMNTPESDRGCALYCPGEENFGYIRSKLYELTSRWRSKFVSFVANDVRSSNPRSVLDIGCGTGDVLTRLRTHGVELYGIDPSPYMLKIAEEHIRHDFGTKSSVHLGLGNNRHIPFDNKFDRIFSSISFHHWKNREQSIPYILSRLTSNGEFTIYEYDKDALPVIRRTIFSKHSISELDVNELDFDGYKKRIEHSSSFIVIRFKKTLKQSD